MAETGRVLWTEGMFLQPQHFQHAERIREARIGMRLQAHVPHGFGFTELQLNAEAVSNGVVSIVRCGGVMPDGTAIHTDAGDMARDRGFEGRMRPEQQSLDVYLALPLIVPGMDNAAADDGDRPHARYRSRTASMFDEVEGGRKRDIVVGDHNLRILFEGESLENHTTLKAARLVRTADGSVVLDRSFVPPLLQIGASASVMSRLRALLETLLAKTVALSKTRRELPGGAAQFASGAFDSAMLLQVLNTHVPLLNHMHFAPTVHPHELFGLLTQLCGALCTFSTRISIQQLPRYDHTGFGTVLDTFAAMIQSVISIDTTAGCVPIPIEQVGTSTYACRIEDASILSSARFFLGIAGAAPDKELVVGTLQRVKMCSRDRLELLIPSAMPGVGLMHVAAPPEELATKPGYIYFSVDQRGELWEGIRTSGTLAFYFPHNYPDLKIEMLALKG